MNTKDPIIVIEIYKNKDIDFKVKKISTQEMVPYIEMLLKQVKIQVEVDLMNDMTENNDKLF